MSLRDKFQKLYRQHFEPNGDHGSHSLTWVDHPMDLDGDAPRYLMNHTQHYWEFFQAGHAQGLEQAAAFCDKCGAGITAAAIRAMKP